VGRVGVDRTIQILSEQIVRTMKLLGMASLAEFEPKHVTQSQRLAPGAALSNSCGGGSGP
jgi:L-lactate dehydrogenase (cytochrome)